MPLILYRLVPKTLMVQLLSCHDVDDVDDDDEDNDALGLSLSL
jgi:hypothetical protein